MIDDIVFLLFQNGQRNKQAMINSIVFVYARRLLLATGASGLKFGEGLGMTKANNGPTFLTNFGVRKSVDPDSRLENIRNFSFMNDSVSKTVSIGEMICNSEDFGLGEGGALMWPNKSFYI